VPGIRDVIGKSGVRARSSLDELAEELGGLDELSLETLINLRRQHDHIRTEIEAVIARKMAGTHPAETDLADTGVLTVNRLAEPWGMKAAKVRELCRTGRVPARKLGKKEWVVPVGALRVWAQENHVAQCGPRNYIPGDATGRDQSLPEVPGAYRVEVRRGRGVLTRDGQTLRGRPEGSERGTGAPHAAGDGTP
jgi:hypothetical protein